MGGRIGHCGNTRTLSPTSSSLFGTDGLGFKTRRWTQAFQVCFLRSTLRLCDLVKTLWSMWFQYLLVQCLITITGDGGVPSWPSSSAGERKADYLSQQRPGLHCGNSRQIGSSWDGGSAREMRRDYFHSLEWSFAILSLFSARTFTPQTRRAGCCGSTVAGLLGHLALVWESASCNDVSSAETIGAAFHFSHCVYYSKFPS